MNASVIFESTARPQSVYGPILYVKHGPIWEYMRLVRGAPGRERDEAILDALETEGWELVDISIDLPIVSFCFKRLAG